MALAQRTGLLLLDEPTSFLDIAHQVEVLDLVRDLSVEDGTTIVMVLHDLPLAARYADHLIAMRDGAILAQGRPREVVTADTVRDVFGITCRVTWEQAGDVSVIPVGRHRPTDSDEATLAEPALTEPSPTQPSPTGSTPTHPSPTEPTAPHTNRGATPDLDPSLQESR